ncbi:MAG: hypothetical protein WCA10_21610 [Terracidiphilus sp.]
MNRATFVSLAFLCVLPSASPASDYAARRTAAKQQCEAIDPSAYQSGLFFNPDGYRSYYVQSECFQKAAVQFRDARLCDRVRRRWSMLSSSWGVSSTQCQKLVSNGVAADRTELEKEKQLYAARPVRLLRFRVERNGNGRDFDFIPEFSPGYAHGYRVVLEIVDVREQPILLHSDGYYVDPNSRLNIFIRQADIRSRFPEFQLNHTYKARATILLSVGMGGDSGYWSDEFIENTFPLRERSQSLTIESKF